MNDAPSSKYLALKIILSQQDAIRESMLAPDPKRNALKALENLYTEVRIYPSEEMPSDYYQSLLECTLIASVSP